MPPLSLSSMTRPKSILLATDLNDLNFLLPVAVEQAKVTGSMLWLLHVIPPTAYVSTTSGEYPTGLKEKAFREAEATLAGVALQLKEQKVPCAYEVRRWYAAEQVKEFIRERGIERLLVGTASRGKLGKLLLGSVAEELIRSVEIPVCTVGPNYKPLPQNSPRRVIFATSLRHHPEQSLHFAVDLAARWLAELTVMHVTEQDRYDEGLEAGARSKIEELLRGATEMHMTPHVRIRGGEPAEEILSACTALNPQWLVMSAVPASAVASNFRSGVAYRVIAQAPCPTFTLRSGPRTRRNGTYREFSTMQTSSSYPG
ncbi:MAG TPA: universal stress protein [Acidobacteriaceae bacterium]|nr:universal stress protein [Acidobacteriaceae bacterium]